MTYTVNDYTKGKILKTDAMQNAVRTVAFINDVLAALGSKVRITSTIRTPAQNAAANGVSNSRHLESIALAVDFVPVRWEKSITDVVRKIAQAHGFGYLDHDAGSGRHIHCEFRGNVSAGAAKKKVKTK